MPKQAAKGDANGYVQSIARQLQYGKRRCYLIDRTLLWLLWAEQPYVARYVRIWVEDVRHVHLTDTLLPQGKRRTTRKTPLPPRHCGMGRHSN